MKQKLDPQGSLNQTQFESLFKLHFAHLCHFAGQFVKDSDTARDICQQVFMTLWENRAQIDPQQSVKTYLFTSVKNRCLNFIRDHKKYRSKVLDLDCADFDVSFEEDPMVGKELSASIEAALNALPDKCRTVFEMSRFQQMKYAAIAEALSISPKTVEAHMIKALKELRAQLKDLWLWTIVFFW